MKKLRLLIPVMILAAIAGGIYYYATLPLHEIVLTGVVTTDSVIASSQLQGRLDKLLVKQGDEVKKGQLLATIQPAQWQADMSFYQSMQQQAATQVSQAEAELKYQELQTQNQIKQAQANLDAAEAQVKQTQADLEIDLLTFQREEQLFKKGIESQQAYDQARTTYDSQKARVDTAQKQALAAKSAVDLAKSTQEQITSRRAAWEATTHQLAAAQAQKQKAQVQLDYTQIIAPIDGIVDVRASLQGEVVNPGQAIITLIDPADLWVRADVEETYIDRIKLGDRLKVTLPSGKVLEGTVYYRALVADFATQRDVSRTKRDIKTFEVRLRCPNDGSLAVGMTAYITLPLDQGVKTNSEEAKERSQ